jgi:hypothetical protein
VKRLGIKDIGVFELVGIAICKVSLCTRHFQRGRSRGVVEIDKCEAKCANDNRVDHW